MDFDYKKYSLENLEKWMSDALLSSEATPQEIYDVIRKVVEDEYHYFKHHTSRCYELLALLNGNGKGHMSCDKDDPSEECKNAWTSFWEENHYPEEYKGSTVSSVQYTEEELNAMCDRAASDDEKEKCREYNLREAEYYDKRARLDFGRNRTYDEMIAAGYTMTDDGFWIPSQKEEKVKKWILPTEVDGLTGDVIVNLPDDLLEAANLKEGDQVEWIDNGEGSYIMKKATQPLGMEEC